MAEDHAGQHTSGTDVTWAALLAHWTDFAKSAVALPKDGEGGRMRRAVPSLIGLQAITMALNDLARVSADERPVAQDRAAITIRKHAAELHDIWKGEPLPEGIIELIDDARAALRRSESAGVEFIVGAERLVEGSRAAMAAGVRAVIAAGFDGDLWILRPGTALVRGLPAAFARSRHGGPVAAAVLDQILELLPGCEARPAAGMRQVYRRIDESGRVLEDLAQPLEDTLPAGMPLLIPAIEAGRPVLA